MSKELFFPKEDMFKNPAFKNMDEYKDLVSKFDADYEGTWAKFADEKMSCKMIPFMMVASIPTVSADSRDMLQSSV